MTDLEKCVEQIRVAFNALPNIQRPRQQQKLVKEVQTLKQLKKALKDEYTGFYGLWSPRSKKFVFGIQEENRAGVKHRAKKRLGKRWKDGFEVRKIRYRNESDFHNKLREVKSDG